MAEWILTLQIQISLAVVVILLLRQVMKKMPKVYSYLLWLLVFARLLVPVSIESRFSFMPSQQEREELVGQMLELGEKDYTGESGLDNHGEDGIPGESIEGNVVDNKNMPTVPTENMVADNLFTGSEHIPLEANPSAEVPEMNGTQELDGNREAASDEVTGAVLFALWIAGVVTVLGVNGFALVRLQRFLGKGEISQKVAVTNLLTGKGKSVPVYLSEKISTPFTLGLRKPVIYLPAGLTEGEKKYILCHEQVHITRKDNLVKHVTFFLTAVYWFNPFVWVAFFLMERDMEMSCDEKVLKLMGGDIKRNYSQSLLNFAKGRGKMPATHLTFGENSVKQRVKNVLSYKNAKKWSIAIGAVVLVGVVVALFTTGRDDSAEGQDLQGGASIEQVDGQENLNDGSQSGGRDDLASSLITDLLHVYPTVEEALNYHFEKIMRENSNIVYPDYEYDEKAGKAVIRYFVNEGWERYVLLETVKIEKQEEFYYVERESLKDYSTIETTADFEALYGKPGLRNLNLLNYSESFYRYILQQLYTGSGSAEYYAGFTDPVQAAVEMLNLGEGSGVAKLKDGTVISGGGTGSIVLDGSSAEGIPQGTLSRDAHFEEGTYAYVTYTFAKDGSTVEFPMRLIEGGYGLWSVDADAVREAVTVQNYGWGPSLEERYGFSVEVSEYGVYRNENGVLTNIYPYYIRDSRYENDGILYFPIDSQYQEGYYDYAVDTICMLDLVQVNLIGKPYLWTASPILQRGHLKR